MKIDKTSEKVNLDKRLELLFKTADSIYNLKHKKGQFLVDKLIPKGALSALVGESDTGKSSFLRQLALSVVYGDSDFLGFKIDGSCRNVLYVSTEDGEVGTSVGCAPRAFRTKIFQNRKLYGQRKVSLYFPYEFINCPIAPRYSPYSMPLENYSLLSLHLYPVPLQQNKVLEPLYFQVSLDV